MSATAGMKSSRFEIINIRYSTRYYNFVFTFIWSRFDMEVANCVYGSAK